MNKNPSTVLRGLKQRLVRSALAIGLIAASAMNSAHAIDVDPGDFIPAPAGTSLGLLYLQGAHRDSLYAGSQKLPGSNGLDSQIGILRGLHFTSWAGMPVGLNVVVPFGRLEGKDQASFLGAGSGVGDVALVATVWPHADQEKGSYASVANYLFLPTGSYDRFKPLNLGEHRWKYIAQPNFLFKINDRWSADLIADVTFYGRNSNFGTGGTASTMKQNLSTQLQGFVRYSVSPGTTLHAGLSYARFGATEVNGVDQNDAGRVSKFVVGGSTFVAPKTQLLVSVGRDLKVSGDPGALMFKESARVNFRILQIF